MADIIMMSFGDEHDVVGDSRRTGYETQIEALAVSFSGSGQYDAYHQRMAADIDTQFSFTLPDGIHSTPLAQAFFKTHKFAKVLVTVLRREGSAIVVAKTIELEECYLTSWGEPLSAGSGANDSTSWSMVYDKMTITGKGNKVAIWSHEEVTV